MGTEAPVKKLEYQCNTIILYTHWVSGLGVRKDQVRRVGEGHKDHNDQKSLKLRSLLDEAACLRCSCCESSNKGCLTLRKLTKL